MKLLANLRHIGTAVSNWVAAYAKRDFVDPARRDFVYERFAAKVWVNPTLFIRMPVDFHRSDERNGFKVLRKVVLHNKLFVLLPPFDNAVPDDVLLYCLDNKDVWVNVLSKDTAYLLESFERQHPQVVEFINTVRALNLTADEALEAYLDRFVTNSELAEMSKTADMPDTLMLTPAP